MMYTSGLWGAEDPPRPRAGSGPQERLLRRPRRGRGRGLRARRRLRLGRHPSPPRAEPRRGDRGRAHPRAGRSRSTPSPVRCRAWTCGWRTGSTTSRAAVRRHPSFGAFEHFARDGTTGPERIATYRSFFARCYDWLAPGGRLGLETIVHDDAPDTATPRGRGPLGDSVLALYPESICPHLSEVVLGLRALVRGGGPPVRCRRLRADVPPVAGSPPRRRVRGGSRRPTPGRSASSGATSRPRSGSSATARSRTAGSCCVDVPGSRRERRPGTPVVGRGGRVTAPGGLTPDELWATLCAGRSVAEPFEDDRLPAGHRGPRGPGDGLDVGDVPAAGAGAPVRPLSAPGGRRGPAGDGAVWPVTCRRPSGARWCAGSVSEPTPTTSCSTRTCCATACAP